MRWQNAIRPVRADMFRTRWRCIASRTAVLDALEDLALAGHVRLERVGRANQVVLPAA